jgi:hypothetical protein
MSMRPKSTSYEVQVFQDQHWVLSQVVEGEGEAIEFADNLLSRENYQAVRVVRDFKRLDGMHKETVLVEKTKAAKKQELTTATLAEAPICAELADAFTLPSRLTIGRIFRSYLDEVLITPTELLHNAREMKRLADKGNLLMNAVDQISRLQAPQGGDEAKERREFLFRSWDQLEARARKAAPERPPRNLSLAELAKLAAKAGDEPDYALRVMVAAQLIEQRGWLAKLDMVLRWAAEEGAGEQMALLDGLVADLLIPAETIQDLLGAQTNLAAALAQLCDLADGKAESAQAVPESFAVVNRLFAEGRLPQAQQSLLSRVSRELRSVNPLSRNQPDQEFEAFLRVLNRMVSAKAVTGGPLIAEALTHRFVRQQNVGGLAGLQNAIDDIVVELGGRCRGTIYLLALSGAPKTMEQFGEHVLRTLARFAEDHAGIDEWLPARLPPPERMAALTSCNGAILASETISEKLKTDLAKATDGVLVEYLERSEVIEKIDRPDDPLAFRALRLVKFCCSGALIKGRSLDLAQKRILGHLRQPNFEEKFLSSIPDKGQAERHLREFHKLLVSAGFKF